MEEVGEPVVEALVLVVRDLEQALLDTECVADVLSQIEPFDLGYPPAEIQPVEELNPFLI